RGPTHIQSIVGTPGLSMKAARRDFSPGPHTLSNDPSIRLPDPRSCRSPMGYRSLSDCIEDLRKTGRLVAIDREVDPKLEAAAIQRRVYEAGGPALFFPRVKGTAFSMVGNLFGSRERTHYIFRDTLEAVRHLVELKVRPPAALA